MNCNKPSEIGVPRSLSVLDTGFVSALVRAAFLVSTGYGQGQARSNPVMSKIMAGILIAYGGVLSGLGFLVQNSAPQFGRITAITGYIVAVACLLWGVAAFAGLKGRGWAILSTGAAAFVLLSQTVHAWMASPNVDAPDIVAKVTLTVMLALSGGMMMYLLHGERSADFYKDEPTRRVVGGQQNGRGL